jgi:hypothetical protein
VFWKDDIQNYSHIAVLWAQNKNNKNKFFKLQLSNWDIFYVLFLSNSQTCMEEYEIIKSNIFLEYTYLLFYVLLSYFIFEIFNHKKMLKKSCPAAIAFCLYSLSSFLFG